MDDLLGLRSPSEAVTHLNKNDEPPSETLCLVLIVLTSPTALKKKRYDIIYSLNQLVSMIF